MSQHPTLDKRGWDGFELHPVTRHRGSNGIEYFEVCEPDDPNLYCWSVYAHLKQGGVECIADCFIKEDAEFIYEALVAHYNPDVK